MDELNLSLHARELLSQLVAAWEQSTPEQRIGFALSPSAGQMLGIEHPGLPNGGISTRGQFLAELESAGLVQVLSSNNMWPQYRPHPAYYGLTTKGERYIQERRRLEATAGQSSPSVPRVGDSESVRGFRWWLQHVIVPLLVPLLGAGSLIAFLFTRAVGDDPGKPPTTGLATSIERTDAEDSERRPPLGLSTPEHQGLSVNISGLQDGARIPVVVDSRVDGMIFGHHVVSGSSSGVDPSQDIYLLSGELTSDQWWVYETVRASSGEWEGRVCYGFAEVGKSSYLLAVVANRDHVLDIPLVEDQQVVDDPDKLEPVAESETIAITIGALVEDRTADPTDRCE